MSARLGTATAMLLLVLLTLGTASITDIRAYTANVGGKTGASAHQRRRGPTDGGTIAIQSDAFAHGLDIRFAKAGVSAVFAFRGTMATCLDTRFKLFVRHNETPYFACQKKVANVSTILANYVPKPAQSTKPPNLDTIYAWGGHKSVELADERSTTSR